jgi:hypothetical protein
MPIACPVCESDHLRLVQDLADGRKTLACVACGHQWTRGEARRAVIRHRHRERTGRAGVQRSTAPSATRPPDRRRRTRPRDEPSMRASPSKRRSYLRLRRLGLLELVAAANRAYLEACVHTPDRTEKEYWALSCMPTTTRSRVSAISMKGMEVFVLHDRGGGELEAFVVISRGVLRASLAGVRFSAAYPRLHFELSHYRDGGRDQMRVSGDAREVMQALADEPFAAAAEAMAARLMSAGRTMQWFGHNYQLADAVLGRGPDEG